MLTRQHTIHFILALAFTLLPLTSAQAQIQTETQAEAQVPAEALVPAPADEPLQLQCGPLLESQCQSCHYLPRVCLQVDKRSKRGWKATMRVMVRRGAKISQEDQGRLIDCLAEADQGIVAACKK